MFWAILTAALCCVVAVAAAWYWYKSTLFELPSPPKAGELIRASYFQEVYDVMVKSTSMNKIASVLTGFAAILGAVSAALGVKG